MDLEKAHWYWKERGATRFLLGSMADEPPIPEAKWAGGDRHPARASRPDPERREDSRLPCRGRLRLPRLSLWAHRPRSRGQGSRGAPLPPGGDRGGRGAGGRGGRRALPRLDRLLRRSSRVLDRLACRPPRSAAQPCDARFRGRNAPAGRRPFEACFGDNPAARLLAGRGLDGPRPPGAELARARRHLRWLAQRSRGRGELGAPPARRPARLGRARPPPRGHACRATHHFERGGGGNGPLRHRKPLGRRWRRGGDRH
jgi:hypothetical protein